MRPETPVADSEFEAILKVTKLRREEVRRIRLERCNEIEIDLDDYTGIIAGGSPFDVSCPAPEKTTVQMRIESFFDSLFGQVIDRDFPFLGACSGSGLLGKYSGATISGRFSEPVGSVTVSKTIAGEKDALLKGLPQEFTALVGHKEACDSLPPQAVLLLTSNTCPVQMFRIKQNVYATQFHPEADAEEFTLRINTYKDHGYFHPEKAEELIFALQKIETPVTKEILRRFATKYRYEE